MPIGLQFSCGSTPWSPTSQSGKRCGCHGNARKGPSRHQTRSTPYTVETPTVGGGSMHWRSAAVTQLNDVVVNQVQLAMAKGNYKHN